MYNDRNIWLWSQNWCAVRFVFAALCNVSTGNVFFFFKYIICCVLYGFWFLKFRHNQKKCKPNQIKSNTREKTDQHIIQHRANKMDYFLVRAMFRCRASIGNHLQQAKIERRVFDRGIWNFQKKEQLRFSQRDWIYGTQSRQHTSVNR